MTFKVQAAHAVNIPKVSVTFYPVLSDELGRLRELHHLVMLTSFERVPVF